MVEAKQSYHPQLSEQSRMQIGRAIRCRTLSLRHRPVHALCSALEQCRAAFIQPSAETRANRKVFLADSQQL